MSRVGGASHLRQPGGGQSQLESTLADLVSAEEGSMDEGLVVVVSEIGLAVEVLSRGHQ